MTHRSSAALLVLSFAIAASFGGRARGDLVELVNGQILQGDISPSDTGDEGLGLKVFDTGGTVVVRWDHIEPARRKQLRVDLGLDTQEADVEYVPGHRVKLVATGETVLGVAQGDPRTGPLKLKTRTGVREFNREALAGPVEEVSIDGLLVYTVEELYQRIKDDVQPEKAAAHKQVAQRAMNIGAYDHAKEHLAACKNDPVFMDTSEGKAVEAMDRQCDVGIKAKGAQDLKTQILIAEHDSKWNDALKLLKQLDATYKDKPIRDLISLDNLATRVGRGRDTYFQREIARDVFRVMDSMIEKKAREQKAVLDPSNDPNARPGTASPGTLSAARQWENKELVVALWEKVAANLGLEKDELEKYWTNRTVKNPRRASYNTGSFIVVKKVTAAGRPQDKPRRPPGADRKPSGKNVPRPAQAEKPKTDEEWWETATTDRRSQWLIANFVESSGYFKVERADETNCTNCGGTGQLKSNSTSGEEEAHFCPVCNGCGRVKLVIYK